MSPTRANAGTAQRKLICCLLAVEIAEHDTRPVSDQIRLTRNFRQLLSEATAHANADDLVSIVREDRALLSFIADPRACFMGALRIREATLTQDRYRDLPLRIGVNLGTVEIAEDEFGQTYLSGQGRQDAERVMRQGPPGQVSVAGSFFELLSRAAPELAGLLQHQGVFSDTIGPALGLYRLDPPFNAGLENLSDRSPTIVASSPAIGSPMQTGLAPQTVHARSTGDRRNWHRRAWPRRALLPMLALGAVFTLSSQFHPEPPVLKAGEQLATVTPRSIGAGTAAASPSPAAENEATRPSTPPRAAVAGVPETLTPAASSPLKPRTRSALAARRTEKSPPAAFKYVSRPEENLKPEQKVETDDSTETEAATPPTQSGTLYFAVRPWGELYVDGRKIGVTPPLKSFEVPPGRRVVTIRNGFSPIYQRELTVKPDAKTTVAHDFSCVSTREKPCREGLGEGLKLHLRLRLETAEAGHSQ